MSAQNVNDAALESLIPGNFTRPTLRDRRFFGNFAAAPGSMPLPSPFGWREALKLPAATGSSAAASYSTYPELLCALV